MVLSGAVGAAGARVLGVFTELRALAAPTAGGLGGSREIAPRNHPPRSKMPMSLAWRSVLGQVDGHMDINKLPCKLSRQSQKCLQVLGQAVLQYLRDLVEIATGSGPAVID